MIIKTPSFLSFDNNSNSVEKSVKTNKKTPYDYVTLKITSFAFLLIVDSSMVI